MMYSIFSENRRRGAAAAKNRLRLREKESPRAITPSETLLPKSVWPPSLRDGGNFRRKLRT